MKKLHRLIIGSFSGPFIITFFLTLFILVMQFLWKYVDDMVGKGLEFSIIAELLFYASANLVPMALPLAILLSSIMTFGNLGENYELVAIKSSGISLQRTMMPLIIVTIALSILAFYFSNNVWPVANLKFASLLHDVTSKKPAIDIKEGIFYKDIDGYVIRVGNKDNKKDILYDVTIYDHTDKDGNRKVIRAEEGSMKMSTDETKLVINLKNGVSYDEVKGNRSQLYQNSFKEETIFMDVSDFKLNRSDEDIFKNNYKMLNLRQLTASIDTLYQERTKSKDKILLRVGDGFYFYRDTLHQSLTPTDSTTLAFNIDNLKQKDKLSILQSALNITRRNKTYIQMLSRNKESNAQMIVRHKIEWHRKFTLSIACLILFFIGAPLGAIIRKGGLGMPVIVSVLFFLVFHVLSITGEKLAKESTVDVATGMWAPTVILFPIGLFLTLKATSDSALFDADAYKLFFIKILKKEKKN